MWVRSLSLPPPHPLVLTGKGRSFLQPKLPTLPLRPFPLSVCALLFPYYSKGRVFAAFAADFCGGLLHFCLFLWSCAVFGGGGTSLHSTQFYFLFSHVFYWYYLFIFPKSSAWCCALVTLVMSILMAPTLQYTLTQVPLLHSFCMNVPLT